MASSRLCTVPSLEWVFVLCDKIVVTNIAFHRSWSKWMAEISLLIKEMNPDLKMALWKAESLTP